jgi:hypothetical protein
MRVHSPPAAKCGVLCLLLGAQDLTLISDPKASSEVLKTPYLKAFVRFYDIAGQRFERLIALVYEPHPKNPTRNSWRCVCDCGKTIYSESHALRHKRIKSCGCLRRETTIKRSTTHGQASKNKRSKAYLCWKNLRSRSLTTLGFVDWSQKVFASALQPLPISQLNEMQVSA